MSSARPRDLRFPLVALRACSGPLEFSPAILVCRDARALSLRELPCARCPRASRCSWDGGLAQGGRCHHLALARPMPDGVAAAVHSEVRVVATYVLLAGLLVGLRRQTPLSSAASASVLRGASSILSLPQLDQFEDRLASSSRSSAVCDTELAQSCGVT